MMHFIAVKKGKNMPRLPNTYVRKRVKVICMKTESGFLFGEQKRDGTFEIMAEAKTEKEFLKEALIWFGEEGRESLMKTYNIQKK